MAIGFAWQQRTMAAAAAVAIVGLAGPASAQDATSREVVQPLPPPEAAELSEALKKLAVDPQDFDALIAAGNASLELDDTDAALGFFTRAEEVAPGSGRTKAGIAATLVKDENPFDALRLFDEAERAGTSLEEFEGERALAYDLVGDNLRAQRLYREILARGDDAEVSRRLAISLAISGDQAGMEKVLLPMLQRRDLAAYRARAFSLAILGKVDDAMTITDAVMPGAMAARVAPYLRYMPKLTRAQQAAAANLGNFPQTAEIGRDDPRLAQYVPSPPPAARPPQSADARLVPTGAPLGSTTADGRRTPDRPEDEQVALANTAPAPASPATSTPVQAEPEAPKPAFTEPSPPPPTTPPATTVAAAQPSTPPVSAAEPEPTPDVAPTPAFDLAQLAGSRQAATAPAPAVAGTTSALQEPAPAQIAPSEPSPEPAPAEAALSEPAAPLPPAEPSREQPADVAAAFADFQLSLSPTKLAAGAVDLAKIEPAREKPVVKEEPKPAKPVPPKNPARYWVQLATGKDRKGLGFDFRRITSNSKGLLKDSKGYLAHWGETNRLLTGPFKSEDAAQAFVTKLNEAGIRTFTFSSDEGEEVTPLPAR